jgi:hypothetical protein
LIFISACSFGIYRIYWCTIQGKCPHKISEEVDNIRLTIYSPKRFYEEDETVMLLVSIKNNRKEEARLYSLDDQPALELWYRTKNGDVLWHEQHPELSNSTISLDPGEVYEIEIRIPPEEQIENERGNICARILVNNPGGWNGGYGFGTCLTYNNWTY